MEKEFPVDSKQSTSHCWRFYLSKEREGGQGGRERRGRGGGGGGEGRWREGEGRRGRGRWVGQRAKESKASVKHLLTNMLCARPEHK